MEGGGASLCGGGEGLRGPSKFQCIGEIYETYVQMKRLPQREFSGHNISAFLKFRNFSNFIFTHEIQNQNMVTDISRHFDMKSLSLKNKSREIFKPLHLGKLVQAKILRHKCSQEVKKLVCNTMSSIIL